MKRVRNTFRKHNQLRCLWHWKSQYLYCFSTTRLYVGVVLGEGLKNIICDCRSPNVTLKHLIQGSALFFQQSTVDEVKSPLERHPKQQLHVIYCYRVTESLFKCLSSRYFSYMQQKFSGCRIFSRTLKLKSFLQSQTLSTQLLVLIERTINYPNIGWGIYIQVTSLAQIFHYDT